MRHRILPACLFVLMATTAWAQAPVGTISGTVRDQSDAVLPAATVTIRSLTTGVERHLTSNVDGTFTAPALAAGTYEVLASLDGFRNQRIEVTVATGRVSAIEMNMELGGAAETVNVAANAIHVETEAHAVSGVITRQEIQELPLNGRSFLQLAFLEPGVTASAGSTSQYNSLFSVSILGGDSNKTAITVDGGNIRNNIEGNTGMNFSQEVVEEFQLSSANFDLSTGITSVGAVNIVTRTGSNDLHGSGYYFFRNNDMAAYPALRRDPLNPNPDFSRQNPGAWARRSDQAGPPVLLRQLRTYRPGRRGVVPAEPGLRQRPRRRVPESVQRAPDQRARRLARERQPQRVPPLLARQEQRVRAKRRRGDALELAAQREPVGADRRWPHVDLQPSGCSTTSG